MGRFVMDMEGQATFGHCLQPLSSSSSSSSSSIIVVVIIAVFLHCLHCNNRSSQNPYFSPGKVYVEEYRCDKQKGIVNIVIIVIIVVVIIIINIIATMYFSSGKVYVGEYRYDKENGIGILRFFTSQRLSYH